MSQWGVPKSLGPSRALAEESIESRAAASIEVLLVTEGTYPYHFGGVSTWCHSLVTNLQEVQFHLLAICAEPPKSILFELPDNVVDFRAAPLWGLSDPTSTLAEISWRQLVRRRTKTDEATVKNDFVPIFERYLEQLYRARFNSTQLARSVHEIYRYFRVHDFRATVRSRAFWESFERTMPRLLQEVATRNGIGKLEPSRQELTTAFNWHIHWLFPLATELPDVPIVHIAMSGVCTLVAVAAKIEHGSSFFLTEHGVYLRETYLAEAPAPSGTVLKFVTLGFARRMTELTSALADQISPCCDYNQRWERANGAKASRLKTIYYGVDAQRFAPEWKPVADPLTVVWVGRINPLKDVETLIRAAGLVHAKRPEIQFHLYGSASAVDQAYYEACLALREELALQDVVHFKGYVSRPQDAFNSGDIVLLPSISEGFPYSTLEAMLCGKPIIASRVGGLAEQVGPCGMIVEPRAHASFAEAILELAADYERCERLGREARYRAEHEFSVKRECEDHRHSYEQLAATAVLRRSRMHADSTGMSRPNLRLLHGDAETAVRVEHDDGPARGRRVGADDNLDNLTATVEQRAPHPFDSQEVAALIESLGVNDTLAREKYGTLDVFDLGRVVFRRLQKRPNVPPLSAQPKFARDGKEPSLTRPVQTMLTALAAFIALEIFRVLGDWRGPRVNAMALGFASAMVVTNCAAYGMARRVSSYLALGDRARLQLFVRQSLAVALAGLTVVIALGAGIGFGVFGAAPSDVAVFAASAAILSSTWLLAATASTLGAPAGGTIAVLALASIVFTDRWLALVTSTHLLFATIAGVALATDLLLRRLASAIGDCKGKDGAGLARTPRAAYSLVEAFPYAAYGLLSVGLLVLLHVGGWLATPPSGVKANVAFTAFEAGITLALVPLMACSWLPERIVQHFWDRLGDLCEAEHEQDAIHLDDVVREGLASYIRLLAAVSATAVAVYLAVRLFTGLLDGMSTDTTTIDTSFVGGLFGFGLFGAAQLSASLSLTVSRPGFALKALVVAFAVAATLGVAAAMDSLRLVPVAFAFEGLAFLMVSVRLNRRHFANPAFVLVSAQ